MAAVSDIHQDPSRPRHRHVQLAFAFVHGTFCSISPVWYTTIMEVNDRNRVKLPSLRLVYRQQLNVVGRIGKEAQVGDR